LISHARYTNKPTEAHLNKLKAADPNHPLVRKLDSLEEKFTHAAAAF